jgi:ribulose-phosphate 3-epimerase
MLVSASLLAADFACLGEEVKRADRNGSDSFHLDVMDGHYVPNIALSLDHLAMLRPHTHLPFHVHLELSNPDDVLEHFRPFQADSIIVCRNTLVDPQRTFALIRARGARVGLSIDPQDSVEEAARFFPELDLLVILGVTPGFGGQPTHPNTTARLAVARAAREREALHFVLAVDGGVTMDNAPALADAGADMLIIGTALFRARRMRSFVEKIKAVTAT